MHKAIKNILITASVFLAMKYVCKIVLKLLLSGEGVLSALDKEVHSIMADKYVREHAGKTSIGEGNTGRKL